MEKFLTTSGCSALLDSIIRKAKTELYLVSPFIRLNDNLYERLKFANDKGINIHVVFGKEDLLADARYFFMALDRVNIYFHQSLHAKCYYNEKEMLLTSMNLYVSSARELNREMGIAINKANNTTIYEEAKEEVRSIISASEVVKEAFPKQMEEQTMTSSSKILGDVRPPEGDVMWYIFKVLTEGNFDLQVECTSHTRTLQSKGEETKYSINVKMPNGRTCDFSKRLQIPFPHWSDPNKALLSSYLSSIGLGGRVYSDNSSSINIYLPSSLQLTTEEDRIRAAELFLEYFWKANAFFNANNNQGK